MSTLQSFDAAIYVDTIIRLGSNPLVILRGDDNPEIEGFYERVFGSNATYGERSEYMAARRHYVADPEATDKVCRELFDRGRCQYVSAKNMAFREDAS